MLTGGQVAGLIVAVFWAILVSFLAFVLLRLAKLLGEAAKMVADIGDQTGPLLDDMTRTVKEANEQLHRVDVITKGVAGVTQNVSAVTTVMTSVVSGPLVKGAAFAYGVRKVLGSGERPGRIDGRTDQVPGRHSARRPGRELPARAGLGARTVDGERR